MSTLNVQWNYMRENICCVHIRCTLFGASIILMIATTKIADRGEPSYKPRKRRECRGTGGGSVWGDASAIVPYHGFSSLSTEAVEHRLNHTSIVEQAVHFWWKRASFWENIKCEPWRTEEVDILPPCYLLCCPTLQGFCRRRTWTVWRKANLSSSFWCVRTRRVSCW